MAELVAAGAPELPEGYFYRVAPSGLRGAVRVQVRRQRLIGSVEIERSVVIVAEHADALSAVVFGCRNASARMALHGDTRVESLYGDHDPRGGR
ncbi:hypothetical protein B5180_01725 [Streptomyces sp. BF-3]|nr:hypothetical protein B5180_01725 [Streptomyces sp. BF-3]